VSILRLILATMALFLGPPLIGVLFGFVQLGVYRLLVRAKAVRAEDVPMFPILFLRGMMILIAIVAAHVFYYSAGGKRIWILELWQKLFG